MTRGALPVGAPHFGERCFSVFMQNRMPRAGEHWAVVGVSTLPKSIKRAGAALVSSLTRQDYVDELRRGSLDNLHGKNLENLYPQR